MMSAESTSEKSVSYQKKDLRGHARPSFFWYDNDSGQFSRDRPHLCFCCVLHDPSTFTHESTEYNL